MQGAGWLTLEDLRWDTGDGPRRGQFLTQAASTYKLPSFSEMPEVFNVTLLRNATEEGAVYGSKAVGEPPLMLAFSVREALRQAAFGRRAPRRPRLPSPRSRLRAVEHARDHTPRASADANVVHPAFRPAWPPPESERAQHAASHA